MKLLSNDNRQVRFKSGPLDFDEEEDYPLDVWVCSECQRRFIILDEI